MKLGGEESREERKENMWGDRDQKISRKLRGT
jgi:hypothetical protein